ncbi:hypothetical protein [Bacteroides heparinolyticus]|uniref:hypothetical protein n=1 Tax=Prevotella heparinolytica TaxID=28113 RepID=UPI0035A0D3E5
MRNAFFAVAQQPVKVLFYFKKKAPKNKGNVPVKYRGTVDGTIAQFNCKCGISPSL